MLTEEEKEAVRQKVNGMQLSVGLGYPEAACSIAAINLALDNRLSDIVPYCMSEAIGSWIIRIQDAMPSALRNSKRWKSLLPDAAGTGREQEGQRLDISLDWMWNTVLPTLQPLADKLGFGSNWLSVIELKTSKYAYLALQNLPVATTYTRKDRLIEFAKNALRSVEAATNSMGDVRGRSRYVASTAVYCMQAIILASPEPDVISIWETIDPCGLLERLIKLEPSKEKQDAK